MKGHRTEVEVCDVDVEVESPAPQEETSNSAAAAELGLEGGGGAEPAEAGMVDLARTVVSDRFYREALPVLTSLAQEPTVQALGQDVATDGLEEESPCEDLGFEELADFATLVGLWSQALDDIDDPVFPLLEESLYAAADAAGGELAGLAQVVEDARTEALRTAECDPDRTTVIQDVGLLPVDADRLADVPALGALPEETCPTTEVPAPLPDLGTCDPVTVEGTVSETMPPTPGTDHVLSLDPDEVAGLECAVAFTDELQLEVPPTGLPDRLVDVGTTVAGSAIGPFFSSFGQEFTNSLVFDTVGRLGDDILAAKLLQKGATGASKIPAIGPTIAVVLAFVDVVGEGGARPWAQKQVDEFAKGGTDLRDAFVELGAAWGSLTEGEGWEAATHLLNSYAESNAGLATLCGAVATIAGLLSAVLYVAAFGATLTGFGAAAAPVMIAMAQGLGSVAGVLGVAALAMSAAATMWRALAATIAPVDMYEQQSGLLEDSAEALGKSGGSFAGGQLGGALSTAIGETVEARRQTLEAPEAEGPDGRASGTAAADAEAERLHGEVEEHADRIDEHVERAEGTQEEPGSSPGRGIDVSEFVGRVGGHLRAGIAKSLDVRTQVTEGRDHAQRAFDLARGVADAPDHRSLGEIQTHLSELGDDKGVKLDDLADAEAQLAAGQETLAAYLARDVRNDPPGRDHVDHLTRLHAQLSEYRADVAEAQRQVEQTQSLIHDTLVILGGEAERLEVDVARAGQQDTTGKTVLDLLLGCIDAAKKIRDRKENERAALAQLTCVVDLSMASMDAVCTIAEDVDAGDAAFYVAEHEQEILADMEALEDTRYRLERLLEPPPMSLQEVEQQGDLMAQERDAYLVDQVAAYALGQFEGAAVAGEGLLLPEGPVQDVQDRAEHLDGQLDDALQDTADAQGLLSAAQAESEAKALPADTMEELAEAQSMAGEHSDVTTQGSAPDLPDGDPAQGMSEAGAAMAAEAERLASDQERLTSTQRDVAATRSALDTPIAEVTASRQALTSARDEASAGKASALGDADMHRSEAEGAAESIATDIGALKVYTERQRQELSP